jgi:hypothetical protein
LINVDFPQPFGPNTEVTQPLGKSRLKFEYTGTPANDLFKPRTVMWARAGARLA